MTLPREILPGRFYMITRRCTQRQFLLRPDDATNNGFVYCLGEAAARFGIDVILPVAMSNHIHTVVFDRNGTVIEFIAHFHKLLAKSQNALRRRWENLFASESASLVHLVDRRDVLDKLVYAATNPVKDGLVERVHHWPGINGLSALLLRRPLQARRPAHFFRALGPMPEQISLHLTLPPELGDLDDVRQQLRERVAAVEADHRVRRLASGRPVLGRRRVLQQSWRDSPFSREPRRNLRPRLAARNTWRRLEALRRNRAFLDAYRKARTAWLHGMPIPFPPGTYWLRRFVGVPVLAEIV